MKLKYNNKSSIRTKELIWKEFTNLIEQNGNIDKIKVTDLCKRVGIERATFYCHYKSIEEVANDIRSNVIYSFFKDIEAETLQDIYNFFDRVGEYLRKYEIQFRNLANNANTVEFAFDISEICTNKVIQYVKKHTQIPINDWIEMEASFFSDGLAFQLIRYFKGRTTKSLKQILGYCKETVLETIKARTEFKENVVELNNKIQN